MSKPLIFLASASPRRRELLAQIGIGHEARAVDVDESERSGESPTEYVRRLAALKATTLWSQLPADERKPVLAADTTVVLDGRIFGKPSSPQSLRDMLGRLSARTHQVHTAVALMCTAGLAARLSSSEVTFRELSTAEIDRYWATGEPADKAGGYAVQGRAAVFVSRLAGSYSGVVGLPLYETWELLEPVLGLTPGGAAA
jgi:septum formation protein